MEEKNGIVKCAPSEIETESFRIIQNELFEKRISLDEKTKQIVLRVIHATADFDFAENILFSENVVEAFRCALLKHPAIVTDTNMALAGVNQSALKKLSLCAHCFMSDSDVALEAKNRNTTRAFVSVEKAFKIFASPVIVCGNAPTALLSLCSLLDNGFLPSAVIACPVGFVNVIEAKEKVTEKLLAKQIPFVVTRGRKGGSTVATAICNAFLYLCGGRDAD